MYRKFVVCVAFASVLWTISEGSTPIRKCTEELPSPHFVQVNDCEVSPCVLHAGSTANITIKFNAVNSSTENVQAEVIVYANDDAFPYQMPNDYADVCKHLSNNARCPLNAGDAVDYNLMLPLDENVPDVFVEVEIAVVDEETKNCMSCFVVDVRVKAQKHHLEKN